MALFAYRATTPEGAVIEGVIEAIDEKTAVHMLRNSGVIPLRISPPEDESRKKLILGRPKIDVLTFTTELSALLSAGLPLDRSLNILAEISDDRRMSAIIKSILKSIREGRSFSEALQLHPHVFSRLYINMIRAGESGGVLGIVLDKLNEFLESTKDLRDTIVSAMVYPVILLLTGIASIAILLVYVLPKFSQIFSDMGVSLPLATQILITVSGFIGSYWWIMIFLAVFAVAAFKNYTKTESGRFAWDSLKLRLMGDIIRKLETARFARTLGTLLRSGVPLIQALNNSRDVISNSVIAAAIIPVSRGAKEGKGIAVPLARANVLPALALSMIKVGEETGQLDDMLLKVAATYEKSLRSSLKRFLSFLEPALILGMALVIGSIVISMLMAIFSITDLPF